MLKQETILVALNKLLNQTAKIRKCNDAMYFCPNCNHYKRKLEINLFTGKYNCWVCHFSGLSFRSLFKKLKAPLFYYNLLGEVEQMVTIPNDWDNLFKEEVEYTPIQRLPDEFKPLHTPLADIHYKNALRYLISRGISKYDILRYNIGYCDSGYYQNRIIIPSYDASGLLNFFSARDYTLKQAHTYKLCDSSKNIIGFELFINFDEPVTLVEGQFDAIAVRRNCIPLFGKTMSRKLKTQLLASDVPRVNVMLDNDAEIDANNICSYLTRNGISTHCVKLSEKDPSILGFQKTWELINKTNPVGFYDLVKMQMY